MLLSISAVIPHPQAKCWCSVGKPVYESFVAMLLTGSSGPAVGGLHSSQIKSFKIQAWAWAHKL